MIVLSVLANLIMSVKVNISWLSLLPSLIGHEGMVRDVLKKSLFYQTWVLGCQYLAHNLTSITTAPLPYKKIQSFKELREKGYDFVHD